MTNALYALTDAWQVKSVRSLPLGRAAAIVLLSLLAVALTEGTPNAKAKDGAALIGAASEVSPRPITKTILVKGNRAYRGQPEAKWLASFKIPRPPGYVLYSYAECGRGLGGCMFWKGNIGVVKIGRTGRSYSLFAHEMGHVFDMYVLSAGDWRARWGRLAGKPWKTPYTEEEFADAYATCALNRTLSRTFITRGYGNRITPARHLKNCRFIRAAYADWLAHPSETGYGQVRPAGLK